MGLGWSTSQTRRSSSAPGRCPSTLHPHPTGRPGALQTVYARADGSAAAPTAGLHFTPELLEDLGREGIHFAHVILHVGLDTFRPVQSEEPEKHKLHSEYFEVGEEAAREINLARAEGRRIISVGTTSVRVLEQAALLSEGRVTTHWPLPWDGQTYSYCPATASDWWMASSPTSTCHALPC